jgi:predicted enzyme related to lactoylglutathione lyase
MSHVAQHAPGAFCWIELAASDQNAAKHFYTSLFDWTFEDNPMGPNEFYTMFNLEGKNAGAAYTLRAEETAMQVTPHWNLYIAVASADAATARAAELGATVLAGPFDVFTHGRMAVISDPTGAVFCVWEAKSHIGLGIVNQAGAFCWADLSTPDQGTAATFYAELFGYTLPPGEGGYLHIQNGETFIGGIQPAAHRIPNAPPHWQIYIQVDDCAAGTKKAKGLGASIYMEPTEVMNAGIMSVVADPQGAVFALFQPMPRKQ